MSIVGKNNFYDKKMGVAYLGSSAVWGTAGNISTGHAVFAKKVSWPKGQAKLITDETRAGLNGMPIVIQKEYDEAAEWTITTDWMPGEPFCLHALAAVFGGVGGTAADTVITHNLQWLTSFTDANIADMLYSVVLQQYDAMMLIPTSVITKVRIYYEEGWQMDVSGYGNLVTQGSVSTYNPANITTIDPDRNGFQILANTNVYLNAQSGADFQSTDIIGELKNFEMMFERGLESGGVSCGASYNSMPKDVKIASVTIKGEVDSTNSVTQAWWAAHHAATLYKAKIVITGNNVLASATPSSNTFLFPGFYYANVPEYGVDTLPVKFEMKWQQPAAAPTGMTEVVPTATLVNGVPLATMSGYPAIP